LPAAQAAPAPVYEVQVRMNGEDAAETVCTTPKIAVVEGGHGLTSLTVPNENGNPIRRMMHVQLGRAEGDCVHMTLTMTPAGLESDPASTKLYGEKTVHFNTVTGVVLSGEEPEPRCAEVMVSRSKLRVNPPVPMQACTRTPPPPVACVPPASARSYNLIAEPVSVAGPMPPPAIPPCPFYMGACPHPMMTYLPGPIPQPAPALRPPAPPVVLSRFPVPVFPPPPVMGVYEEPRQESRGRGSYIRVVHESGKAKLKMKSTDGTTSTAVRMKVETSEVGSLRFAAGKKHVHVSGKMWKASADHVEMYDDGVVILTGHVKVVSGKVGVCSSLTADRACLDVRFGKIESIDGAMFSNR
jgi:hypothetical protein